MTAESEPELAIPIEDGSLPPDFLRRMMIRAKLEVVDSLLKSLRKELHLEKPGEREALGQIESIRHGVRGAANLFPLRRPMRTGA